MGEQVTLISRFHIPQLMETGRKSPALALTLPWKCKVCKTGATGDLHTTLPSLFLLRNPSLPLAGCSCVGTWSQAKIQVTNGKQQGQGSAALQDRSFWCWSHTAVAFMNLLFEIVQVSLTAHLLMCSSLQPLNTPDAEKTPTEASQSLRNALSPRGSINPCLGIKLPSVTTTKLFINQAATSWRLYTHINKKVKPAYSAKPKTLSALPRFWHNCVGFVSRELGLTETEVYECRSPALSLDNKKYKSMVLMGPYWSEITRFLACFYWQQFCWQSAAWEGRRRHLTQRTTWAIGIMLLPWTTSTGML